MAAFAPVKMVAPSLIASSDASTATTVVTPTTVTSDDPRRWPMLRKAMAVSASSLLEECHGVLLAARERVGDLQPEPAPCRYGAADQREQQREGHPGGRDDAAACRRCR